MKVTSLLQKNGKQLLVITIILIVATVDCLAQNIFMGTGCPVKLFHEDSAAYFDTTIVNGSFKSEVESDLIFKGQRWESRATSSFAGNGRFTFKQPNSGGVTQELGGESWDNRFPNMILRNPNDINLFGVAGVRDSFTFDTGHLFHNKFDFVVGDGDAGTILGYDQTKYFVTNHNNTSDSGFLVRQNIGAANIDFPVGNAKGDYTPAQMNNSGTSDTFYVRVFPNVYEEGNTGSQINDLTVKRTWNILENTGGGSSVNLSLQHNVSTEGALYTSMDQFVSRYYGVTNNAYKDTSLGSKWDYAASGNGYTNTTGDITTGSNVGRKATRSASITSSFGRTADTRYFTKSSTSVPVPVELLYFTAKWESIDDAKISWSTASELNNQGFQLLRSYDGSSFEPIHWEPSKAAGGNSWENIQYDFIDQTILSTANVVYYKLVQQDLNGQKETYGPKKLERNSLNKISVYAYPVPSKGDVTVVFSAKQIGAISYNIINAIGQTVYQNRFTKTDNEVKFNIPGAELANGTYWVQIKFDNKSAPSIKPIQILIAI